MAGTVTARCVINKQNVKVCYPPTTITSGVESVVAGTNVTVDDTDPRNPIVSSTGGGGGITGVAPVGNLLRVLTVDGGGNVVTVEASGIDQKTDSGLSINYLRGELTSYSSTLKAFWNLEPDKDSGTASFGISDSGDRKSVV